LDQGNNQPLTIRSSDGQEFNLAHNIAMQSKLIKAAYEDQHELEIPVNINSVLLKPLLQAMELLYSMKDKEPSQKIIYETIQQKFFNNFSLEKLTQGFQAAIYLDVPKLENVFADKIAQLINKENINAIVELIDPNHWFLIEKFYYLHSLELRPSINNLLLNDNVQLVNALKINPVNINYKREKIIKQWKLSVNDLVDYNKDTTLINDDFDVQALHLQNCYLASIDGLKRIANINNCQELYLGNNQLTNLGNSLHGLNALKTLHLDNNQLTDLGDSLHGLNYIKDLNISNNQLTNLGDSLHGCIALWHLNLSGNQLTDLENKSFAGLNKLKKLYLSKNPLTEASKELLNQLTNRGVDVKF